MSSSCTINYIIEFHPGQSFLKCTTKARLSDHMVYDSELMLLCGTMKSTIVFELVVPRTKVIK